MHPLPEYADNGHFLAAIVAGRLNSVATIVLMLFCTLANATEKDGSALADAMLERLGGRANWAELRNTINGSQQNRAQDPTVVYAVITMDFTQPRFRIETTASDLHLIRVINGKDSWRLRRSGEIEDIPPDLYADDMQWYASHLYRTIHRLAARDPSLATSASKDGRLQVLESGKRILWFRLDSKGEPYAFGAMDDEVGSLSGPWDVVREGIHHPRWVSSADGSWRAAVRALEVNVPLHGSMFARPDSR